MLLSWEVLGATVGVLGFLGLMYKHKYNQLDTRRERELYLVEKLKGRGWQEPPVIFEIDDTNIEERIGWRYRLKRWGLRPLEGTTLLSLKSRYLFTEEILESRLIDEVGKQVGTGIKYMDSLEGGEPPVMLFRVNSVEDNEIMPVVITLTMVLSAWMQVGNIEYTHVKT